LDIQLLDRFGLEHDDAMIELIPTSHDENRVAVIPSRTTADSGAAGSGTTEFKIGSLVPIFNPRTKESHGSDDHYHVVHMKVVQKPSE
jgi:hypothetical protein